MPDTMVAESHMKSNTRFVANDYQYGRLMYYLGKRFYDCRNDEQRRGWIDRAREYEQRFGGVQ